MRLRCRKVYLTNDCMRSMTAFRETFRTGICIHPGNDYCGSGRALEW